MQRRKTTCSNSSDRFTRLMTPGRPMDLGPNAIALNQLCHSESMACRKQDSCRCGLIFIQAEDPLSRVARAIMKQDFTTMGFYCYTTCASTPRDLIILIDLFENTSPCFATPDITLEDLRKNPLISRIAIKRLRDPSYVIPFRKAVAEVATCARPSILDMVHAVFGDDRGAETRDMPVDVVNRVIARMGRLKPSQIQPDDSVSVEALDRLRLPRQLGTDIEAKYQLLDLATFPFTSRPEAPSLASYLKENQIFGELEEVVLPNHPRSLLERAKQEALHRYRSTLDRFVSVTVDEIMKDPDFFSKIIEGVNFGRAAQASHQELSEGMLSEIKRKIDLLLQSTGEESQELREHLRDDLDLLQELLSDPQKGDSQGGNTQQKSSRNGGTIQASFQNGTGTLRGGPKNQLNDNLRQTLQLIQALWQETAVNWLTQASIDLSQYQTNYQKVASLLRGIGDPSLQFLNSPAVTPVKEIKIAQKSCMNGVSPLPSDQRARLLSLARLLGVFQNDLTQALKEGDLDNCSLLSFLNYAQTWSQELDLSSLGLSGYRLQSIKNFPPQITVIGGNTGNNVRKNGVKITPLAQMIQKLTEDLREGQETQLEINALIKEVNQLTGSTIEPIEGETTLPINGIVTGY